MWSGKALGRRGEDSEDNEAEDTDGARSLLEGVLGAKDHTVPSGALRGPGQGQRDLTVIRERKRERDLGGHGPLGRRGCRPKLLFHPRKAVSAGTWLPNHRLYLSASLAPGVVL